MYAVQRGMPCYVGYTMLCGATFAVLHSAVLRCMLMYLVTLCPMFLPLSEPLQDGLEHKVEHHNHTRNEAPALASHTQQIARLQHGSKRFARCAFRQCLSSALPCCARQWLHVQPSLWFRPAGWQVLSTHASMNTL